MRKLLPIALITLAAVAGCSSGDGPELANAADAVVDIPTTHTRDQRETSNCWLYATTAWVESLERSALQLEGTEKARPPSALSVSYLDYWDWYSKITGDGVHGSAAKAVRERLDSGGSWGYAVEIMARYGVVRASAFGNPGVLTDADLTNAALDTIVPSLLDGPLKTPEARKNGVLVRKELDKAFRLTPAVSKALSVSFGVDGDKSFTKGNATDSEVVIPPGDFMVLVPQPDGQSVVRPLSDAIGHRLAPGDDPDQRGGEFAWRVVSYTRRNPAATRAYLRRIQRALHAGVALPLSWFLAANGDPEKKGEYRKVPAEPADIIDSVAHETLITDYEVTDVPGFGTLKAGKNATAAQREAALDESANIVFFRVTDSYATRVVNSKRVAVQDLYIEYLNGTVRVCPAGANPNSRECHNEIPLEDVTLPAGF